jgi:hypothetical protein
MGRKYQKEFHKEEAQFFFSTLILPVKRNDDFERECVCVRKFSSLLWGRRNESS